MEITEEQYARIKESLPIQRGNVSLTNLQVLNAILYVAEQGCKWRGFRSGSAAGTRFICAGTGGPKTG
jgi:transposase